MEGDEETRVWRVRSKIKKGEEREGKEEGGATEVEKKKKK